MDRRDRDWEILRALTGAGPSHPVFPTRRQRLADLRPGEKLLVVRKWGGLGDVIISTMLFPDLLDWLPDVSVTYAVPEKYHCLFDGFEHPRFSLLDHGWVYGPVWNFDTQRYYVGPDSPYHEAGVNKRILEEFDLIEDISEPCRNWEALQIGTGAVLGERGLRWRNRLDRWASWLGFDVTTARSCVSFRPDEVDAARKRFGGARSPVVVWSPISAGQDRTFPWFMDVTGELEDRGCHVFYLHWGSLGPDTLHGLTIREMGAVVAGADAVLSVDTSTFHWGGVLRRPTVGIFNVLLGRSHAKYYPTAKVVQVCDTPCISSRYYKQSPEQPDCERWHKGPVPVSTSRCFHPSSVEQVVNAVMKEVRVGEAQVQVSA